MAGLVLSSPVSVLPVLYRHGVLALMMARALVTGGRSAVSEYDALSVRCDNTLPNFWSNQLSSWAFHAPDTFHVGSQRDWRDRPKPFVPS